MFRNIVFKGYFRILFLWSVLNNINKKEFYVFDIDNTISDTWPELLKFSQYEAYINAKPFESLINFINQLYSDNKVVIFLSARNYMYLEATKYWLTKNYIFKNNVFLVDNPVDKLWFLSKIKRYKVYYFDDLSYNHENGEVKYYNEIINLLGNHKRLNYYGYNELIKIQNANDFKI